MPEFVIFLHAIDPDPKRPPEVIRDHCAHLDRLDVEGRLIAAGPFTDTTGGGIVVGRFGSLEQAQAFAQDDPFVADGYSRPEVRPWAWSHAENGHLGVRAPSPGGHPLFLDALRLRATTRRFSDRPIETELAHMLLKAALAAPSEFNLQPWRPVVCHRPPDRIRLQRCCLDQTQVGAAALAVVCAVDPLVFGEEAPRAADELIASGQRVPEDREALITFIRSCFADPHDHCLRNGMIFGHQLLLAGLSRGLAGFWLGGFDAEALRRQFGLPERVVIAGIVGLGWPEVPERPLPRQPLEHVVGWGRWPGAE